MCEPADLLKRVVGRVTLPVADLSGHPDAIDQVKRGQGQRLVLLLIHAFHPFLFACATGRVRDEDVHSRPWRGLAPRYTSRPDRPSALGFGAVKRV